VTRDRLVVRAAECYTKGSHVMGISDTLRLIGSDTARVRCAAGHPASGELATKDFDCGLDHCYVFEGQLYRHERTDEPEPLTPQIDGDTLLLARSEVAKKVDFTGTVDCHTHCEACDPVVFEREDTDRVDHRHVWCEWNVVFDHGRLTRVEPVRLETREQLRTQMARDGVGVLPDDDRIVTVLGRTRERSRTPWSQSAPSLRSGVRTRVPHATRRSISSRARPSSHLPAWRNCAARRTRSQSSMNGSRNVVRSA
jgi:hypothetical protein